MEESYDPCEYKACPFTPPVELDLLVASIAKKEYNEDIIIGANQEFVPFDQIMKFKRIESHPGAKFSFDIFNDFPYYIIVTENLIINDADDNLKALTFQWYDGTMADLRKSLVGTTGSSAGPQNRLGVQGYSGGSGGDGKTRNAPAIFLFFKKLTLVNSRLRNVNFKFELEGIPGGDGGDGGDGGKGGKGKTGRHGYMRRYSAGTACRGGADGKQGGSPGRGGRGGSGGCGGNGPDLKIYYNDIDYDSIFERAKYQLNGAETNNETRNWGKPGVAGAPGEGGKGGNRAGNCNGGSQGIKGFPRINTYQWDNWNHHHGVPSTNGYDGYYELNEIDNYLRVVFDDPSTP